MFHKIKEINPLTPYRLFVCFEDGQKREYDVSRLFTKWESFQTLQIVEGLFGQVKIDSGGYGVSWNDDLDLSSEEIYLNGDKCSCKV